MSERRQVAMLWWSIALATLFTFAVGFLMHMIGPPSAGWSADEIAKFYSENASSVRIGATLASWSAMFLLPLWAVIAAQVHRQETGAPILTIMTATGGSIMGLFLVLPPIFWGVAAFTPTRNPEITATMHELGVITLVTTDQVYIFPFVALVLICLAPQRAPHSPFPRWLGYYSAFAALVFEAGAFAYNFRSGPLSWNGLIAWWVPLAAFGTWIPIVVALLLKALKAQARDAAGSGAFPTPAPVPIV